MTTLSAAATKAWPYARVGGIETWTDDNGTEWVRAAPGEVAELTVVFATRGLAPLHLVRADQSRTVRRVTRKARREARALKVRGLA